MADFTVAGVAVGEKDSAGKPIITVYGKVIPIYAVYRTDERVVIQYADDPKLGAEQRQALAPANAIKSQTDGLIDGWRSMSAENASDKKTRACLFDREIAYALLAGLQGYAAVAKTQMEEIRTNVLAERTSIARAQYLLAASIMATLLIVIFAGFTAKWFIPIHRFSSATTELWAAAGWGALGGLFSVGIAIRSRSVGTDLQWRTNTVDAISRIGIASISAAILICLLRSRLVTFQDHKLTENWDLAIVAAFAAGFSERLVGDLLTQSVANVGVNPLITGKQESGVGTPAPAAGSDEKNPLGKPPPATPPAAGQPVSTDADDGIDGCTSAHAMADQDVTHDVELPEATGGVSQP